MGVPCPFSRFNMVFSFDLSITQHISKGIKIYVAWLLFIMTPVWNAHNVPFWNDALWWKFWFSASYITNIIDKCRKILMKYYTKDIKNKFEVNISSRKGVVNIH